MHKGSVKINDSKNIDYNIWTFLKFPLNELKKINQNNSININNTKRKISYLILGN